MGRRRVFLTSERAFFVSTRRVLEARVGLVDFRALGFCEGGFDPFLETDLGSFSIS